ncbi:MAG: SufE family protein [Planctomycetota bacterium]
MSAPAASTDPPTLDELREEFRLMEDWEERCEYLIDLGLDLPGLPDDAKTEPNKVHGCQSNVWLVTEDRDDGTLGVYADSDAMLVKGLTIVLRSLYHGKTPAEILALDVKPVFAELGLDRNLSTARKNGFGGMVERVRGEASERK